MPGTVVTANFEFNNAFFAAAIENDGAVLLIGRSSSGWREETHIRQGRVVNHSVFDDRGQICAFTDYEYTPDNGVFAIFYVRSSDTEINSTVSQEDLACAFHTELEAANVALKEMQG